MIEGEYAGAFGPLRDLLERNLADGSDVGAAVAVVHDGDLVADLWGGEARPGVPWTRDTIVQVWSVTKTMAALTLLVLVDRGEVDLDAPVATYWPAFAAAGKGDVLVGQVLGHASGVPGWSRPVSVEDLLDLELSEGWLAEEAPWYEPGSASAYQILDHGHLVDGIVRGATGRPLAEVFRDEVAGPLGADFFIGVPDDRLDDCADLLSPPRSSVDFSQLPPDHFLLRTIANPFLTMPVCNSEPWRRGAMAAAGGHGNARGVARAQAVVSHGGELDGTRLLGHGTIDRIFDVQADGTDLVLVLPLVFGTGYALPGPSAPAVPAGRTCWWTGYGGAIVVNDLDRRTTIAYTPNQLAEHMVSSPRTDAYVSTALSCLEDL
ncbi:serine hydrolase domain-containing protein [Nocardioides sp.]|uniref:serine hydrolase domain-containing protein n=1 Tax=Nocardioides sp. TaxID=35761 RepID=UPI00271DB8D8|nr:serine hydrolase domain-containing protein [Nocardioides sp.]MDO9457761.1 serine hydrolase domain-containing protein [Nocardioides sp.]